jgi:hypothetical protein
MGEVEALGIARFSPGARIRGLEEAIIVARALICGGEPVTFDGEFYKVTKVMPAAAPTPLGLVRATSSDLGQERALGVDFKRPAAVRRMGCAGHARFRGITSSVLCRRS